MSAEEDLLAAGGWGGQAVIMRFNRDQPNSFSTAGFKGKGHSKRINKIKFNARSNLVATVSDDKTCRVWKGKTGEKI